ncbi:hypothetical protein Krac_3596 [Ktedonobacter racemifer DSM 44963]|uniref:Uncharacterized protein n=1 Tax=Ktedonobacter racemifer DSM 44963 TaxID=485913 RepID=D6U282_KTERA|nr:hypothetical protein Krac_3596 [Ktedonobacter racemifer DSM 44963]
MHYSFSEALSREHWPSTTCLFRCTTPPMTCVVFFPCSGIPPRGKGHRKCGAFSNVAVYRDDSPMALDDLGHNIEPHAQTRDRLLPGTSGPIEAFKNLVTLLARDTQAMIAHTDRDRLFGGGELHLDGLGVRRILDGIAEQVGEDLSQPVSIPKQAGLHGTAHQNAMAGIDLLYRVGALPEQLVEIDRLPDVLKSSCLDLGDILPPVG